MRVIKQPCKAYIDTAQLFRSRLCLVELRWELKLYCQGLFSFFLFSLYFFLHSTSSHRSHLISRLFWIYQTWEPCFLNGDIQRNKKSSRRNKSSKDVHTQCIVSMEIKIQSAYHNPSQHPLPKHSPHHWFFSFAHHYQILPGLKQLQLPQEALHPNLHRKHPLHSTKKI